jgi:hypothetical protein
MRVHHLPGGLQMRCHGVVRQRVETFTFFRVWRQPMCTTMISTEPWWARACLLYLRESDESCLWTVIAAILAYAWRDWGKPRMIRLRSDIWTREPLE